jgi:hypothetical protein
MRLKDFHWVVKSHRGKVNKEFFWLGKKQVETLDFVRGSFSNSFLFGAVYTNITYRKLVITFGVCLTISTLCYIITKASCVYYRRIVVLRNVLTRLNSDKTVKTKKAISHNNSPKDWSVEITELSWDFQHADNINETNKIKNAGSD